MVGILISLISEKVLMEFTHFWFRILLCWFGWSPINRLVLDIAFCRCRHFLSSSGIFRSVARDKKEAISKY